MDDLIRRSLRQAEEEMSVDSEKKQQPLDELLKMVQKTKKGEPVDPS